MAKHNKSPFWQKVAYSSLPRQQARRFISLQDHWVTHKGPEWAAARGKAVWNIANLKRAGNTVAMCRKVASDNHIAADSQGYPSGVEGVLVKQYELAQRPQAIKRLAAVLRWYTSLYLPELSEAQLHKSKASINEVGLPRLDSQVKDHISANERHSIIGSMEGYHFEHEVYRLGSLGRLSGVSHYPSLLRLGSNPKPFQSMAASLLTKGYVPKPLIDLYEPFQVQTDDGNIVEQNDWQIRKYAEQYQISHGDDTLGKISFLQEGGAKARVVCSPNAWLQFYMQPIHRKLASIVKRIEAEGLNRFLGYSCMFDQQKGAYWCLGQMEQGEEIHAVDLSSATDRFPLWYQMDMLRDLHMFRLSAVYPHLTGPYWGQDGEKWTYGAGQPMGLYSSFPLFHLSHLYLLEGLSVSLGLSKGEAHYAVLGDDVLIKDKSLLELYLSFLHNAGVPVSAHKCYSGGLTEFAGFMTTHTNQGVCSFRPLKYQQSGIAPFGVLESIGSKVQSWSTWWDRAYRVYRSTRADRYLDLSPLVPQEEDLPLIGQQPPSSYIGAMLNRMTWSTPDLDPGYYQAWDTERFALLKESETLSDQGHRGVKSRSTFDPEQYATDAMADRDKWSAQRRSFVSDPLVAPKWRAQKAILSSQT